MTTLLLRAICSGRPESRGDEVARASVAKTKPGKEEGQGQLLRTALPR